MVFKLLKIVYYLQICADLSKKSKCIKASYYHPPERPHSALSGNKFFRGQKNNSRDIDK